MKYLSQILIVIAFFSFLTESLYAQRRVSRGGSRTVVTSQRHGNHSQRHQPRYQRPRLRVPVCRVPVRRVTPSCSGHRELRRERVWVPGASHRHWVPARYGWRFDFCGHRVRYKICDGHYEIVQDPGSWQIVSKYVWVQRACCG